MLTGGILTLCISRCFIVIYGTVNIYHWCNLVSNLISLALDFIHNVICYFAPLVSSSKARNAFCLSLTSTFPASVTEPIISDNAPLIPP